MNPSEYPQYKQYEALKTRPLIDILLKYKMKVLISYTILQLDKVTFLTFSGLHEIVMIQI